MRRTGGGAELSEHLIHPIFHCLSSGVAGHTELYFLERELSHWKIIFCYC